MQMRRQDAREDLSPFLTSDVATALQVSTYSLPAVAGGLAPLLGEARGSVVALDFDAEMSRPDEAVVKICELLDRNVITIGKERFSCPEALIDAQPLGDPQAASAWYHSIRSRGPTSMCASLV